MTASFWEDAANTTYLILRGFPVLYECDQAGIAFNNGNYINAALWEVGAIADAATIWFSAGGKLLFRGTEYGFTSEAGPISRWLGDKVAKAWNWSGSKINKSGIKAIEAGDYTITGTVANDLANRPYINSPLTITNIMKAGKGVPDAYFAGGVNFKILGTFRGLEGSYELGINPNTRVIYHFLYKGGK
jgi:hypothetical protein